MIITAPFAVLGTAPDRDGDGIPDSFDLCPDTLPGTAVDVFGCVAPTPETQDTDGDGIPDIADLCPATPANTLIDAYGCALRSDNDGDGVLDHQDLCPKTPPGAKVDAKGCAIDSDFDGIPDGLDQCADTVLGSPAATDGCAIDGSDRRSVDVRVELPRAARPPVSVPADPTRDAPVAGRTVQGVTPNKATPTPTPLLTRSPATPLPSAPARDARPPPPATRVAESSPSPSPSATPVAAPTPPPTRTPTPSATFVPAPVPEPGTTVIPQATPSGRESPAETAATASPTPVTRGLRVRPAQPSEVRRPAPGGTRVWQLTFEAGNDYEVSGAQVGGLRAGLAPHREALLRSGRGQVQLIGIGARADDLSTARRARLARGLLMGLGIPGERIIYAVRTAQPGETSGVIDVFVRGIEQ